METYKLRQLLTDAVEIGTINTLIRTGNLKAHISRNQANKMYGRANVDNWINQGLIKPARDNRRLRLDRVQLEIINKTSNL